MNSGSGNNGMLKYLNHSICTQQAVETQYGKLNWNTAAAQPDHTKNRYVVTVRVADRISPLLPAGEYKDQLSVYIEY
ncbi:hypothetical protein [Acinetobacter pragensis]|uniref:Spore coat protein U domain-containing protein n=1 Tax=Acinetobacter pragensis TaxID=1806892 RepID=A0A151Y576_9GAMM|nr:hypothetical protein [Acinetobacter pragensis]KYQ73188.1 hypothetical protein AZH43_07100 [Acinetobacter pragensis]